MVLESNSGRSISSLAGFGLKTGNSLDQELQNVGCLSKRSLERKFSNENWAVINLKAKHDIIKRNEKIGYDFPESFIK